jgi:hypothetical protein
VKRKHIPLKQRLAAALSMLLPQPRRDFCRELKFSADFICSLFEFDHNILHTHGGSDDWWNLTPMLHDEHREKSRRDTAIVAKVKRLSGKRKRPRKKLRSRGFDKTRTRHFDGTVTPRQR